jgi:hypothetical protein
MSNNVQNLVNQYISRYINKIEIIGHKKSLYIEIRLYAVGQDQYNQLFDSLSRLDVNNMAEMAMLAQAKLNAMGIDENKIEQLQKNMVNNTQKK